MGRCYACRLSQQLPLDEAIEALKRDPTHPVRVSVDEELTVEVRAASVEAPRKSVADVLGKGRRGNHGRPLRGPPSAIGSTGRRPAVKYVERKVVGSRCRLTVGSGRPLGTFGGCE